MTISSRTGDEDERSGRPGAQPRAGPRNRPVSPTRCSPVPPRHAESHPNGRSRRTSRRRIRLTAPPRARRHEGRVTQAAARSTLGFLPLRRACGPEPPTIDTAEGAPHRRVQSSHARESGAVSSSSSQGAFLHRSPPSSHRSFREGHRPAMSRLRTDPSPRRTTWYSEWSARPTPIGRRTAPSTW